MAKQGELPRTRPHPCLLCNNRDVEWRFASEDGLPAIHCDQCGLIWRQKKGLIILAPPDVRTLPRAGQPQRAHATELERMKAALAMISAAQLGVREALPGSIYGVKLLQLMDHLVHEIDERENPRSSVLSSRSEGNASDSESDRTHENS